MLFPWFYSRRSLLLLGIIWCTCCLVPDTGSLVDGSVSSSEDNLNKQDDAELERILSATFPPQDCKIKCQCPHSTIDGEDPQQQQENGARLAYLITVHNHRTAEDAAYLFRAIRSPSNIVMVHVDTKFEWEAFENTTLNYEMEACPCGTKTLSASIHSSEWSHWSMNHPTLWGMEMAVTKFKDEWDVFLNLSGDTLPVYNTQVMAQLFHGPLAGINFVTSSSCETGLLPTNVYIFPEFWHKREHYTTRPKGNPVIQYVDKDGKRRAKELTIHFGSQWMTLQPDFVQYLVESLQRPDSLPSKFRDYLISLRRLMTDETFIPTLLMHVHPFNETLPQIEEETGALKSLPSMTSIRYERMDEHSPTAFGYLWTQQRYDVPDSSDAGKPRVWGPYFLGVYDLENIKQSGAIFVRKVSVAVDPNIVHMLPVANIDELPSIQWPNEVKITDKPNWEALKKKLMEKHEEEMIKKRKRGENESNKKNADADTAEK